MEKNQRIEELLIKKLKEELTHQEKIELNVWVNEAFQYGLLYDRLINEEEFSQRVAEQGQSKKTTWQKITVGIPELRDKVIHLQWWRYAAAAVIVLSVLIGGYLKYKAGNREEIAHTQTPVNPYKNDIAPGTDKAILTLSDGSTIQLDNSGHKKIAEQNGIAINQQGAHLVYETNPSTPTNPLTLSYNTLSTPRGGQYQVVLPDGSKVWLNAASSIRYPVAFIGNERKVEITGEAYFSISHNEKMPFKVIANGTEIRDLGTEFNVNAYSDETSLKTTLIEGSIEVINKNRSQLLTPGQQAQVGKEEKIKVEDNVDVDEVTAWKNGRFQFSGTGIEEMMRQISRWYDVEVVYEGKPKEQHFRGGISRNVEASKVFKMLETTEAIKFRIEGKKVIVIP